MRTKLSSPNWSKANHTANVMLLKTIDKQSRELPQGHRFPHTHAGMLETVSKEDLGVMSLKLQGHNEVYFFVTDYIYIPKILIPDP